MQKRILSVLLALCLLLAPTGAWASGEAGASDELGAENTELWEDAAPETSPDGISEEPVWETIVPLTDGAGPDDITRQIENTYAAAKSRTGWDSFNGYCATYVNWQLVVLGINRRYISGNGKDEFDNYKNLTKTAGGYAVTAYPASEYTLSEALDTISLNGAKDVYNILIGFEKGHEGAGTLYGHTCFIHAILGGVVYYSESFDAYIGGEYYPEGAPIACDIATFCAYYDEWAVLDGVICFGGTAETYDAAIMLRSAVGLWNNGAGFIPADAAAALRKLAA